MLTLGIIFLLGIGFYTGVRRGAALELLYTLGYFIVFLMANLFYKKLGEHLELFIPYPSATEDSKMVFFDQATAIKLDTAFYAGTAFVLILFVGWLIVRFIGIFFYSFTFTRVKDKINFWVGGVLGALMVYLTLFFCFYLLSLVPLDFVQNIFRKNGFIRFMVEHTLFFSKAVHKWWITSII